MATGFDLGYSDQVYFYKPTIKTASPKKSPPISPLSMLESSYPTPRNSSDAGGSIKALPRPCQPTTIPIPKPPVPEPLPTMPASPISPDSPPVSTVMATDLLTQITTFVLGLEALPSCSFHDISLDLYDHISDYLERNRVRHFFDVTAGKLIVYCGAGAMHEAIAAPFMDALYGLSQQLRQLHRRLRFESTGATVWSLSRGGALVAKKAPDISFAVVSEERDSGMIVVEIGVSENREQLLQDAREWLWWTEGRVRLVIIVDITKPKDKEVQRDPTKWKGYYEVYSRDNISGNPAGRITFPNEQIFCISGPTAFLPCQFGSESGSESEAEDQDWPLVSIDIPLSCLLTPQQISLTGATNPLHMTIDHRRLVQCARDGILGEFKEKEITDSLKRGREVDDDTNDATYRPGQEEGRPKRKTRKFT